MIRVLDGLKQRDTHFRGTEGGQPLPHAHQPATKVYPIGSHETGLKTTRELEERGAGSISYDKKV